MYKAVSHGGTLGFPSGEKILEVLRKDRMFRKRDERMNTKLARHRQQVLKRRATVFAYMLAAPLAIGVIAYAWRFAINAILQ